MVSSFYLTGMNAQHTYCSNAQYSNWVKCKPHDDLSPWVHSALSSVIHFCIHSHVRELSWLHHRVQTALFLSYWSILIAWQCLKREDNAAIRCIQFLAEDANIHQHCTSPPFSKPRLCLEHYATFPKANSSSRPITKGPNHAEDKKFSCLHMSWPFLRQCVGIHASDLGPAGSLCILVCLAQNGLFHSGQCYTST